MSSAQELLAKPGTIGYGILEAGKRFPARTAFVFGDRTATYAEFAAQTVDCARSLIGHGVQPGDHVGILMPNNWAYAILTSALNLIGACATVLNARYRGEDLQYVVRHADITVLFTTGSARPALDLRALLCSQFPELSDWRRGTRLSAAGAPALRSVFHFDAQDETAWPTEAEFRAAGERLGVIPGGE